MTNRNSLTTEEEAELGRGPLPVGLHYWFMAHHPDEEKLIYGKTSSEQVMFVRDSLVPGALWKAPGQPHYEDSNKGWGSYDRDRILNACKVVSTHKSKSCLLPVYRVDFLPDTTLTFRGNFHDWKLSVDSAYALKLDHHGIFAPTAKHSTCYFEGFSDDWVFGPYSENQSQFSIELPASHEALWFVFRQIANNFIDKHPLVWLAEQAPEETA